LDSLIHFEWLYGIVGEGKVRSISSINGRKRRNIVDVQQALEVISEVLVAGLLGSGLI
jgi:hypothetical protein